jgi:nucleoside-diphosphate-sugar epimerase
MTKKVLVLGGTSWLGGATAGLAVERGHEVTCLARGEAGTAPDGTRFVRADRWQAGAYDEVAGEDWDCVLEVSWQPELVRGAVDRLASRARHWIYVSSCSVYADDSKPGLDETDEVHAPWSGSGAAAIDDYGPAKVACERACVDGLGDDRVLVCRPGLIAGYGDRSDRFGYWPGRVDRITGPDDAVLVPPLTGPAQVVDVADLAEWLVEVSEHGTTGVFNAVGEVSTFADVLAACVSATGQQPAWAEATDQWLSKQGVEPWMGPESLPLWVPGAEYAGFMTRSNRAARAAGLRVRPLVETVRATLQWEREAGLDRARRAGLTPDRERELVRALREAGRPA